MGWRRTAAALLLATLLLGGCERSSSDSPKSDATYDPPEAFSRPQVSIQVNQTRSWGGFELEVQEAGAKGRSDSRDVNLTVDVRYTNLGSEDLKPPKEVTFVFAGKSYPAEPTGLTVLAGETADGSIAGTLTDVAKTKLPSGDELRAILVNTRLVFGAPGTDQAVFPFTER